MGFRFRKSVRICKGVRVNLGKNGASLSVGGRGSTMTFGKNGVRSTVSIPGTGISYSETYGRSSSRSSSGVQSRSAAAPALTPLDCAVSIDTEGNFSFKTRAGQPITDPRTINAIKSSAQWPAIRDDLRLKFRAYSRKTAKDMNDALEQLETIHTLCRKVMTAEEFRAFVETPLPFEYHRAEFMKPAPMLDTYLPQARQIAAQQVKGLFMSKKRDEVALRIASQMMQDDRVGWEAEKAAFDLEQWQKQQAAFQQYQADAAQRAEELVRLLAGEQEALESAISQWLAELELPVEASAAFQLKGETLYLDLDLPEIEDIPSQQATLAADGSVKVKERTQKAARASYATCVFGLGIFMTAMMFNFSPRIRQVVLSAYTQRRDKQGNLVDDYIYSVKYLREGFEGRDLGAVDPEEFFLEFENRCLMTKTKIFKSIEPYAEGE